MTTPENQRHPVEQLAEDFLDRYRRGERPSLSDYTQAHPELAEQIRDLFPALLALEKAVPEPKPAPAGPGDRSLPARLGHYRILGELGRGGMGVVYEAEDELLGRHVALKVLAALSHHNADRLERFRREARSAARLHHTNIVPVFEVGEHLGIHYYAMQFIRGQSLDRVLREVARARQHPGRGPAAPGNAAPTDVLAASLAQSLQTGAWGPAEPPPGGDPVDAVAAIAPPPSPEGKTSDVFAESDARYFRQVARLGVQAAEALAYAHAQQIVHRDIKPSNLLLDEQGTLWVTDFGLAKGEGEDLTRTGDVVGTLGYMAPERFAGVSDVRSDIYGLGLTLYEFLVLRPAFADGDRARLIQRVTSEEPAPPRRLDRRVPRDLETIVLKAIAKEPGRRYQRGAELAEDLRRFLADRPILARRSSAWEQARRWCRRNPVLALLSGAVGLLLLLLVVGSLASAWHMNQVAERATRAEAEATNRLFEALVTRAEAGRTSKRPGQRFDGLEALRQATEIARDQRRPAADLLRLRNSAIALLALPDIRREQEWEGNPPGTNGLAFDAPGERYAWSFRDEGIRVCRLADHKELFRLPTPPADCVSRWAWMRFSPDRRYLAAWYASWSARRALEVWDQHAGQFRRPCASVDDVSTQPEFAADNRTLFVGLPDGAVMQIDLATGHEMKRLAAGWPPERLALHPDGRQLAVASTTRAGVQIRDLKTGAVLRELAHPRGVQAVA
jgi:serine/threonine protein kinase